MNKKSLIVSGVAAIGVIAAIGTSFAMYKILPADQNVNIGVRTDADIQYKVSTVTKDDTALSPEDRVDTFNFNIQGRKVANSLYNQNYVVANLTIDVTPTGDNNEAKTAFLNYVSGSAVVSYKAETYFANSADLNTFTLEKDDELNPTKLTVTKPVVMYIGDDTDFDGVSPVSPEYAGGADYNPVALTLNLADDEAVNGKNFITSGLAELGYQVDISLTEDTDYSYAYVVGDMNGWADEEAYRMIPNIEAGSAWEWMWLGTINEGMQLKAHQGDSWSEGVSGGTPSGNATAPANMTGIYWSGNAGTNVSFSTSN